MKNIDQKKMKKVNVCLIGAGRMGRFHAEYVSRSKIGILHSIVDTDAKKSGLLASEYGSEHFSSVDEIIENRDIEAVILASSTGSHAELIKIFSQKKIPVFCEKPIDLDIEKVRDCLRVVEENNTPLSIGFNRRYDASFNNFRSRITSGEIGKLEMLFISSRDWRLPNIEFLKGSGGLFRDMMIHDIDMANWVLNEEISEVYASGSCLIDRDLSKIGDLDTSMVIMKTISGKLCHISVSRRSVYGYDQRLEAFGSEGMLQVSNPYLTSITKFSDKGASSDRMYENFPQRYEQAYIREINHFLCEVVAKGKPPLVSGKDSLKNLIVANCLEESYKTKKVVKVPSDR